MIYNVYTPSLFVCVRSPLLLVPISPIFFLLHLHAWSPDQSTCGVAEVGHKPRFTSWMASSLTDAIASLGNLELAASNRNGSNAIATAQGVTETNYFSTSGHLRATKFEISQLIAVHMIVWHSLVCSLHLSDTYPVHLSLPETVLAGLSCILLI